MVPGLLEQLANFPSKATQVAGGKRVAAGAPSTVDAPGTRVFVRAQKCLCPAQLAQLPCARTACAHTQLICESTVRSACAEKKSSDAHPHNTAWRDLLASKGLSGAALVLEGYGRSCENDLSLLVQEDLNTLSSQLKPFHSRILRTWVQRLAAADEHHKRDKKRAAGDVNDGPAAKKHSNSPPSAEVLRRRSACFESLLIDRCSRQIIRE